VIDWLIGDWCFGNEQRSYRRARSNENARATARASAKASDEDRSLSMLDGEDSFGLGTLSDGRPVNVSSREIGKHGIVWGSSGAGKSYALHVITDGWIKTGGRLQLIDPKGETYLLKALAAAAHYRSLPEEQRDAYAARFRVFNVSAEYVTPGDLFQVPEGMSPALLAHLRTAATCDLSSHAFSDLMAYGIFLLYSVVINLGWGVTVRVARAFFLDSDFRLRTAAKLTDERLRDSVVNLEITLPEQTRKAIVRQFDLLLSTAPARISFGLGPSMLRELLPGVGRPSIFLANYGPSPQRPPALAKTMATNRLIDVLADANVRSRAIPELLLLEEVGVLVRETAVAEYLLEASRTLRWKKVGIVCVAQDPANAIPAETATALLLNSKWLLSFECGREEALWLWPHMRRNEAKSESEDRRDFISTMAKLPTQEAVLVRKGGVALRLRTKDVPNPTADASRAELLEIFESKIASRSMVRVADAEDRIARFEAEVFRNDLRVEHQRKGRRQSTATSVEDFFERLARMRKGDGTAE
jgi:hypothetical protein